MIQYNKYYWSSETYLRSQQNRVAKHLLLLCYHFKQILHSTLYSRSCCCALSILSQFDLRTAVDCVNNLQSLMKFCRNVSNNNTYDGIHEKAADMVSPIKITMPRIENTKRCIVTHRQNHRRIVISATSTTHF